MACDELTEVLVRQYMADVLELTEVLVRQYGL